MVFPTTPDDDDDDDDNEEEGRGGAVNVVHALVFATYWIGHKSRERSK